MAYIIMSGNNTWLFMTDVTVAKSVIKYSVNLAVVLIFCDFNLYACELSSLICNFYHYALGCLCILSSVWAWLMATYYIFHHVWMWSSAVCFLGRDCHYAWL